ncbi:DoxX family protein [Nocardia sp. NPDC052566]|uniref:DoxX family protein n=1 Tax=Nocardia sp. NPDC052566 TaxID=3364330 RepID=UPI0037C7E1E0
MSTNTASRRTTNDTAALDAVATDIGLLIVRVVFGGLLAAHGSQKLFGWFNGYGWNATTASFDQMGYNPGKLFGTLAGLSEFTGGLLLVFGLVTPLAAAIVVGTMINAVNTMWSGGLLTGKGYELPLLYAAAAAALAFTGPGRFSLDHGRPWQRHGFVWGAGAIVLAVVAAVLTLIFKWVL